MSESRDWTGKTVVITGAKVAVGDLDEEAIDLLADEIGCRALRVDTGFRVSVENFVAWAEDACGAIDLYISNAAGQMTPSGQTTGT